MQYYTYAIVLKRVKLHCKICNVMPLLHQQCKNAQAMDFSQITQGIRQALRLLVFDLISSIGHVRMGFELSSISTSVP